jgi:regulator of sigma E protease
MARRNGVDVEEFGLGFPPMAWSRKLKSGMRLSFNYLPLGGFVKLKGEHDSDTRKGSFGAASLSSKTKIMLAGVTMNLLVGILMLTIAAWIGIPKLITKDTVGQDQFTVASDTKIINQQLLVGEIKKDSPAQKAGLKSTDTILRISKGTDDRQIIKLEQLQKATREFAGQEVRIIYSRGGQNQMTTAKLLSDEEIKASIKANNPKGHLGVIPNSIQIQRSTWSAPIVALGLTKQIIILTFQGLGHAFAGLGSTIAGGVSGNHAARVNGQDEATSQVGGPIAIGVALWNSGSLGFHFMLFLIALISITLALMNILPIPALDGGRLVMILASHGLFRKPLSQITEERIVGASFMFLLALIALITIVDVKRFF